MIRSSLLTALTCLLANGAQASFERYISDEALVCIHLKDINALRKTFDSSAMKQAIDPDDWDAMIAEFFESLEDDLPAEKLANVTIDGEPLTHGKLFSMIGDEVMIAFNFFDEEEPEGVIIVRYDCDPEEFRQLQLNDRPDIEADELILTDIEYEGYTYYKEEGPEDEGIPAEYWAFIDGIAIEATSAAIMESTLELMANGGDSLAESANFLEAKDYADESQLLVYFNVDVFAPWLEEMLLGDTENIPVNPLGVTTKGLLNGLRLESMRSVYVAADFLGEIPTFTGGLAYDSMDGLLSLLTYQSVSNPEWPGFLPSDAIQAGISYFDMPGFWQAILDLMNTVSPNFGAFYQLQIDNFTTQTGVNVEQTIVQNLGEKIIYFSRADEAEGDLFGEDTAQAFDINAGLDQVIALEIRDRQTMETALKTLIDSVSGGNDYLQTTDFEGTTIYWPNVGDNQTESFSYAFTTEYFLLCVGDIKALKECLLRMNRGRQDFERLERLSDYLPDTVADVSFVDLEWYYDSIIKALLAEIGPQIDDDQDFLQSLMKQSKLDYDALGYTEILPNCFKRTLVIIPKE